MPATLPDRIGPRPRKAAAEPFALSSADRKKLASDQIGLVVLRTIQLSKLSQKEFADKLGFDDQSAVSRWVAGNENAQAFGRIFGVLELRPFLIVAIAEHAHSPHVGVKALIEVSA